MTYPRERKILVPGKKRSRGEIKKKVAKNRWIWLLDAHDLPSLQKKENRGEAPASSLL
jgi:hypothetical protein